MFIKDFINKKDKVFVKFIFYYFKVLGTATISFNTESTKSRKRNEWKFTHSKSSIMYNIGLIIFVTTVSSFGFIYASFQHQTNFKKFERVTDRAEDVFNILSVTIIMMMFCFKYKNMAGIANKMSMIYQSLISSCPQTLYKSFTDNILLHIILIISPYIIIWPFIIVFNFINFPEFEIYNFTIFMNDIVITALLMHYSTVLILLKYFFKMFNVRLSFMLEEQDYLCEIQYLNCNNRSKGKIKELFHMRKLYASLYEVSQDVSSFYSGPMFLCIFKILVSATLSLYYVAKPIIIDSHTILNVEIIRNSMFGLIYATALLIFTTLVTQTARESVKTREITNRCIINFENKYIIKELSQFSTFLLQADVTFTVYGFFSLNQSLLTSMTASMTTYLVIILQFQQNN
ncbi:gustatory receptor 40 [Nasonia vitripennis]|uniref:Gustatory receptor n=1 Tax=Nasonia vitripennis TaxID=7425 RepID=A0A7M6UWK9_NASVI|nr:gustatory receptor 40 [Nasonia vitripennis]